MIQFYTNINSGIYKKRVKLSKLVLLIERIYIFCNNNNLPINYEKFSKYILDFENLINYDSEEQYLKYLLLEIGMQNNEELKLEVSNSGYFLKSFYDVNVCVWYDINQIFFNELKIILEYLLFTLFKNKEIKDYYGTILILENCEKYYGISFDEIFEGLMHINSVEMLDSYVELEKVLIKNVGVGIFIKLEILNDVI